VLYIDDPLSLRDGEIVEVDIEINAVNFTLATDGRTTAIDLASAAAHEIGHALGLDHNCGTETGAWPVDETGALVPSCESETPDLVAATMYFQVTPGVVTMRTPEANDVGGLCAVIETRCVGEVSGGCSVTGDGAGTGTQLPFGVVLGGFAFALVSRRRRRRQQFTIRGCFRGRSTATPMDRELLVRASVDHLLDEPQRLHVDGYNDAARRRDLCDPWQLRRRR
jgi:MYXO-CTERM domain-containing protein